MLRTPLLLLAVSAGASVPTPAAEGAPPPPKALKIGESFDGEISGESKKHVLGGKTFGSGYSASIPVALKAGQSITAKATVSGKVRQVHVVLLDPKGIPVASSTLELKTATVSCDEVSASGKYTLYVISDLTGSFTLEASGSSGPKASEKDIKDKIKRLEAELEAARKELKDFEDKANK